jgi:hypothetical protein
VTYGIKTLKSLVSEQELWLNKTHINT